MAKKKTTRRDLQTRIIQDAYKKPTSSGAKVRVYCKLPLGLRIRLHEMREVPVQVMGGGVRMEQQAQHIAGEDILIHGPMTEIGKVSMSRIAFGFAVTEGVDEASWDHWMKDNEKSAMVLNGLIFATPGDDRADDAQAKEHGEQLTGMEQLDPEDDPRRPRPANRRNLTEVGEEDGERIEA